MLKSQFTNHVTHIKPQISTEFHRCGNLWVAVGVVLAKGHPQISTDFHRCGNLWVAVGVVLAKGRPQISTHFHRCGNMWFYVGVGIEFVNFKKHDDNTTSSI